MKKLIALLLAAMMVVGCLAGCGGSNNAANDNNAANNSSNTSSTPKEVVTLDMISCLGETHKLFRFAELYAQMVDWISGGQMKINLLGGDEVMAEDEMLSALKNGVFDLMLDNETLSQICSLYPAMSCTGMANNTEEMEAGLRPALVIGVPVGFVNVVESKEVLFAACERYGVPAIAAMGRKGGSNVAAAICNALIYSAAEMLDPSARGWNG